ncbi:hypothetical protein DRQ16_00225 [bacterium]|nr:MAG: hypothetical protein DRQ16_00225 [bacterium]
MLSAWWWKDKGENTNRKNRGGVEMRYIAFIVIIVGLGIFAGMEKGRAGRLEKRIEALEKENENLLGLLEEYRKKTPEKPEVEKEEIMEEELREFLGEFQVEKEEEEITITVPGKRLFPPGSVEISSEGKKILKKLGMIIKAMDVDIVVEGHTDNSPITGSLKKKFPTNWELSAQRAVNVVKFLISEAGVPPQRLCVAAYAEYRPIASNRTAEGRAKNRRIVIRLIPRK